MVESHDVVFKEEKLRGSLRGSERSEKEGALRRSGRPEKGEAAPDREQTEGSRESTELRVSLPSSTEISESTPDPEGSFGGCVNCEFISRFVSKGSSPCTCTVFLADGAASDKLPKTYAQVLDSAEKEQWLEAIQSELNSLAENKAWVLVERPAGASIIKNRWVLKKKEKPDGSVRFKARLVAKGFNQRHKINYDGTLSPVARFDSVRVLLALTASRGLKLAHFDVTTAFLYGFIDNDQVFMEQPEGLQDGSGKVCLLK